VRRAFWVLAVIWAAAAPWASAQMPDARTMSGIPMPSADVPAGTIVVRVVKGDVTNNVPNHPVELQAGQQTLTATTDADGRATFSGLPSGTHAHAITTVDGERLESDHLEVGGSAGLRVLLVAGVGAAGGRAEAPAGPAVEGDVVFGGDSRLQIEFDDDQVRVFYLLEIVNRTNAPVTPRAELSFTLPDDATAPAVLEESSTRAQLRDRTVFLTGPFAPGVTPVQIAFVLAGSRTARDLAQALPAPWEQVQVIVSNVGRVQMTSAQFSSNRVMPGENHSFHLGTGPALAAGTPLRVTLSGLPVRSRAGRTVALAMAILVLSIGAWTAYGGHRKSAAAARRDELEARRQKLMGDLARVETQRRTAHTPALHQRRQQLVDQLERVYGELDQQVAGAAAP